MIGKAKGLLTYLLSIPSYIWYVAGEWVVKKLFPKSYEVWFAGEIQGIKDIERYLEDRENAFHEEIKHKYDNDIELNKSSATLDARVRDLMARYDDMDTKFKALRKSALDYLDGSILKGEDSWKSRQNLYNCLRDSFEVSTSTVGETSGYPNLVGFLLGNIKDKDGERLFYPSPEIVEAEALAEALSTLQSINVLLHKTEEKKKKTTKKKTTKRGKK